MRRRAAVLAGAAVLAAVVIGSMVRQAMQPKYYSASWFDVFDTVTIVTGYARSEEEWNEQMDALHADLQRYHREFDIYNHYDGVTNLYDVNAAAAEAPIPVDDALYNFLQFAVQSYSRTGGACNIAAGAVLRLWHDARELETPVPPDEALLLAASEHCGITDLILNDSDSTVFFADPDLTLDVGAVGKGYAVEMAARTAEDRGLESALLNVGGNVRAIGTTPDGSQWTAGVENPWGGEPSYVAAVELAPGESLVISGDYQRYFEYGGVRYHHLIDLDTLQPARYVSSVAVLCGQGSHMADAFSTGAFCLPVEDGRAILEAEPLTEALWLLADGSMISTSGWEDHTFE